MPTTLASVRKHAYVDSITLLQITSEVLAQPRVQDASLVMATDLNRQVLRDGGLLVGEALAAEPNDLVLAVRAADEDAARMALEQAEALLSGRRATAGKAAQTTLARSLRSAHRADPEAQLALISVPGRYAAAEARLALADGLHVFLFSDNVPLQDEIELKQLARERGLLVMGPDCGTAILNGVGLGFANVVRRGSIGIVGASGTGIQEVSCLVHQAGGGISHAIGTGSRDLHTAVGGVSTLQAIDLLREDAMTETIVLVAKPSDRDVATRVLRALAASGKHAVAYLQGAAMPVPEGVRAARNLAEAAAMATGVDAHADDVPPRGSAERQVYGLFCGGTLAQEAAAVLGDGHRIVDFGDDEYTRGRAHPMIDPTLRNEAIARAGDDPRVCVILLDFILGLAAHADPAGAALPAIRQARAGRPNLRFVAHVVGTDLDPQGLAAQEAMLRSEGILVRESNYAAAITAGMLTAGLVE